MGRGQRGSVLVLALLMLMVLASLLVVLLTIGSMESLISTNLHRGNQAAYLAEAGMERAFAQMVARPTMISNAPSGFLVLFDHEELGTLGSYSVKYRAAGPDTVLIESEGRAMGGAQRLLRAVVTRTFVPSAALLAEQAVIISGNSRVQGERGSVHSNVALSVSGSVTIERQEGTLQTTGAEGSASGRGPTKREIPLIDPLSLQAQADFLLGDTSIVETRTGLTYSSGWSGWELLGPGEWRHGGSEIPSGTYFALKKILLEGDVGTHDAPWRATLIAGEEVVITGAVVAVPALKDLMIAAGRRISAQGGSMLTGLLIANEGVELGGEIEIAGSVVSKGGINVHDDVVVSLEAPLRTPFTVAPWVVTWNPLRS